MFIFCCFEFLSSYLFIFSSQIFPSLKYFCWMSISLRFSFFFQLFVLNSIALGEFCSKLILHFFALLFRSLGLSTGAPEFEV